MIRMPIGALMVCSLAAGRQPCVLSQKEATQFVMSTPPALKSKRAGHCPKAEFLFKGKGTFTFQLRSACPVSGSGLIGNYTVDLRTGRILEDLEGAEPVDSKELQLLRERFARRCR